MFSEDLGPAQYELSFGNSTVRYFAGREQSESVKIVKEEQFSVERQALLCIDQMMKVKNLKSPYICEVLRVQRKAETVRIEMPKSGVSIASVINNYETSPWSQSELVSTLLGLIEVLATAQTNVRSIQEVVHRQPTLWNLLVEEESSKIKLANFEPVVIDEDMRQFLGLLETRYHAPEVRRFLSSDGRLPSDKNFPYKSDVWVLGLSFLQLAFIGNDTTSLLDSDPEQAIKGMEVLDVLPDLHCVLSHMLVLEERVRPDFVNLLKALRQCQCCKNPLDFSLGALVCPSCRQRGEMPKPFKASRSYSSLDMSSFRLVPKPSANPSSANPSSANPSSANPSSANPSSTNPSSTNPSSANPLSTNPSSANPLSVGAAKYPVDSFGNQVRPPVVPPKANIPIVPPQVSTPAVPPQVSTPAVPPQVITPAVPPQVSTPAVPPQVSTPVFPPQANPPVAPSAASQVTPPLIPNSSPQQPPGFNKPPEVPLNPYSGGPIASGSGSGKPGIAPPLLGKKPGMEDKPGAMGGDQPPNHKFRLVTKPPIAPTCSICKKPLDRVGDDKGTICRPCQLRTIPDIQFIPPQPVVPAPQTAAQVSQPVVPAPQPAVQPPQSQRPSFEPKPAPRVPGPLLGPQSGKLGSQPIGPGGILPPSPGVVRNPVIEPNPPNPPNLGNDLPNPRDNLVPRPGDNFPPPPVSDGPNTCYMCNRKFQPRPSPSPHCSEDYINFCSEQCTVKYAMLVSEVSYDASGFQPVANSESQLKACIHCSVMLRGGAEVDLPCDPTHRFCSKVCAAAFLKNKIAPSMDLTLAKCPKCDRPIPADLCKTWMHLIPEDRPMPGPNQFSQGGIPNPGMGVPNPGMGIPKPGMGIPGANPQFPPVNSGFVPQVGKQGSGNFPVREGGSGMKPGMGGMPMGGGINPNFQGPNLPGVPGMGGNYVQGKMGPQQAGGLGAAGNIGQPGVSPVLNTGAGQSGIPQSEQAKPAAPSKPVVTPILGRGKQPNPPSSKPCSCNVPNPSTPNTLLTCGHSLCPTCLSAASIDGKVFCKQCNTPVEVKAK